MGPAQCFRADVGFAVDIHLWLRSRRRNTASKSLLHGVPKLDRNARIAGCVPARPVARSPLVPAIEFDPVSAPLSAGDDGSLAMFAEGLGNR